MRFLTYSLLSLLAASNVAARCASSVNIPDTNAANIGADALTMFVTNEVPGGTMSLSALSGGAQSLTAADNICSNAANFDPLAAESYAKDVNFPGQTVAFIAVLSSSGIDAINRIPAGLDIKAYTNPTQTSGAGSFKCIAADRSDLYTAADNKGYNLDSSLFYETGETIAAPAAIWTGTGVPTFATQTNNPATASAASYGGRYFTPNPTATPPAPYLPATYCNDWGVGGIAGTNGPIGQVATGGGAKNTWIVQTGASNIQSCNVGTHLLCVSGQGFAQPNPPGGGGDPQFVGLQGQNFQVHGMPEEYFNLITTPAFQLNSRFTYLASGQCNYNNTECWTHPGTYVDQLGFQFPGVNIKAVAGPHHKGLRVWVNEEELHHSGGRLELSPSSNTTGTVTVAHTHHDVLSVSFALFTLEVTNSDWFFNFNLAFHAPDVLAAGRPMHFMQDARQAQDKPAHTHYLAKPVYPAYPMHGLVGQTWKNARYPSKRMYQGEVDDYMILDHQLFSTQFMYNLYEF